MKGLLHSRRFKRNLRKWLFMYVVAMLLITTVATYSKYVSTLSVNDQARVTRFHLIINDIKNVNSKYSQVSIIPYEFEVDTGELEVNTLLILSIRVNDDFKVLSVVDDYGRKIYDSTFENSKCFQKDTCNYSDDADFYEISKSKNYIRLKRTVDASDNTIIKYIVNVRYNNINNSYLKDDIQFDNVVQVGYSATQVRK